MKNIERKSYKKALGLLAQRKDTSLFDSIYEKRGKRTMKNIQTKSYKKAMLSDQQWTYKGHTCKIEMDHERDDRGVVEVSKAYHSVITPEGKELFADISPYDTSKQTLNMWIDAGYPPRPAGHNYDRKDLEALIAQKGHKGILPPKDNNTPWLTNQEPPKV